MSLSNLSEKDGSMSALTESTLNDSAVSSPIKRPISTGSKWSEITSKLGLSPCFDYWSDARANHDFQVRGPTYLYDRMKIPAGEGVCPLLWFDIFSVPESYGTRVDHISNEGACAERVKQLTNSANPPFLFITAIQVPGTPMLYLVMYWAIDPSTLNPSTEKPNDPSLESFYNVMRQYIKLPNQSEKVVDSYDDDDEEEAQEEIEDSFPFQNSRFKLIPRIMNGPWLVKRAVGSVPCLLGTKVTTRYYRGENYMETNVEVGSSIVAQRIIGCCRGSSAYIDVQLGIVLQGENALELPEKLLGAIQFKWLQVDDVTFQVPLL
eukprot:CAMPEP_0171480574 /NCGR_PEP_ID=MMETSP0946-20130122/6156_1 /TAXON_ID=109269 /ORGANISM="Vaucheria litorea, Strain CCMP2940" /LENGTH=320 /DNA_ID=CAMNT_0012011831 /DNA_START=32 /DNA_END=994 /DNA_ORIENTATION=-